MFLKQSSFFFLISLHLSSSCFLSYSNFGYQFGQGIKSGSSIINFRSIGFDKQLICLKLNKFNLKILTIIYDHTEVQLFDIILQSYNFVIYEDLSPSPVIEFSKAWDSGIKINENMKEQVGLTLLGKIVLKIRLWLNYLTNLVIKN